MRWGRFFRNNKTIILSIGFLVLFSFTVARATPPTSPYTAGITLDPSCAPGSTNCTVSVSTPSLWDTVTGGINYAGGNVGIGTTSPAALLDVSGLARTNNLYVAGTGPVQTIGTPTNFAANIVYNDPSALVPAGGYSNNFKVYAYKLVNGTPGLFSETPATLSSPVTDDGNSGHNFVIDLTWDAVSGADGYRILFYLASGNTPIYNYDYYADTNTNSFTDTIVNLTAGTPAITPTSIASYDNTVTIHSGQTDLTGDFHVTGNVGIGTAVPGAALDIEGDGSLLAVGTFGSGVAVPDAGAGTRLMWIPSVSAFRAGTVAGTEWDSSNVGQYSTAFGVGSIASGMGSFVVNTDSGYPSTASGRGAVAMGNGLTASGDLSVAFGNVNTVSGLASVVFGQGNTLSGATSAVFGNNNTVSSDNSVTFGFNINASSYAALSLGRYNIGGGNTSSWVSTDPLLEIGNGTSSGALSDALIVLKNGYVGINTASAPIAELNLAGDGAIVATGTISSGMTVPNLGAGTRMMWIPRLAAFRAGYVDGTQWNSASVGFYSAAFGHNTTASGTGSVAFGYAGTTASGGFSAAFGDGTTASGAAAVTFGAVTAASGTYSAAFGYGSTASGDYSVAAGYFGAAASLNAVAFGVENIGGGDAHNWIATDPLFELGNGTITPSVTHSDALIVLKNGSTGIALGNAAPSYTLQVGSSATATGIVARFQNVDGTCDINPTTASLACSSDMTLKKNITSLADNTPWSFNTNIAPASQSVLDDILSLTPVTYNWNSESDTTPKHPGFIAQDVQQVFPTLVSQDPKTGLLSLNYTGLIPYTIEALKELNLKLVSIDDLTKANSWRDALTAWFADAGNGIGDFVANNLKANNQVCIQDVCLTKADFERVIQERQQQAAVSIPQTTSNNSSDSSDSSDQTQSPDVTPPPVTTPDEIQSPEVVPPAPDVTTQPDATQSESTSPLQVSQ